MTAPLELTRMTRKNARALSLLAGAAGEITLPLHCEEGEEDCRLRVSPSLGMRSWAVSVNGRWGETDFSLFFDEAGFSRLLAFSLSSDLSAEAVKVLPRALKEAALEALLEPAVVNLAQVSEKPVEIVSVEWIDNLGPTETLADLKISHPSFEVPVYCSVNFSDGGAETAGFISELLSEVKEADEDFSPCCKIRLGLEVGETTVTVEEIRQAEAGDVLMLDDPFFSSNEKIRIRIGERMITWGVMEEKGVRLQERVMQEETPQEEVVQENEEQNEAVEETEPVSVGELKVRLLMEIDSRMISLDELQELKPGAVIETCKDASAPVSIRANGSLLGTGELVNVEGKIGIRIVKGK